jgi:hypothetical protein
VARTDSVLSRPLSSACIAVAVTVLLAVIECGQLWACRDSWSPSFLQPAETFRDALGRELLRWLYLSAAAFATTLLCATVFDYAHQRRSKWLARVWTPCAVVIVWMGSSVAYIPEPDWSSGVITEISLVARYASLLAGGAGLLVAAISRRIHGAKHAVAPDSRRT